MGTETSHAASKAVHFAFHSVDPPSPKQTAAQHVDECKKSRCSVPTLAITTSDSGFPHRLRPGKISLKSPPSLLMLLMLLQLLARLPLPSAGRTRPDPPPVTAPSQAKHPAARVRSDRSRTHETRRDATEAVLQKTGAPTAFNLNYKPTIKKTKTTVCGREEAHETTKRRREREGEGRAVRCNYSAPKTMDVFGTKLWVGCKERKKTAGRKRKRVK